MSERARYAARRIAGIVPLVLVVYSITFLLIRATPGNPFAARSLRALPPETLGKIEAKYGLDRPWYEQYATYLWDALRGDFGPSYSQQGRSVRTLLTAGLDTTLTLVVAALVVAVLVGVPLGILAARRAGRAVDHALGALTTIGVAVPTFVSIPVLIIVLGVYNNLVPTGGWGGLFSRSAIVPVVALAFGPAAVIAWFTRASMIDVLDSDYLRTARAQGLDQRTILYRRGLKNGLIPVLTVIGTELTALLTTVFFAENIAAIPGFGREMVLALGARDYPVIMAGTLMITVAVAMINVAVDLTYGFADPRVRVGAVE